MSQFQFPLYLLDVASNIFLRKCKFIWKVKLEVVEDIKEIYRYISFLKRSFWGISIKEKIDELNVLNTKGIYRTDQPSQLGL